jgi:hypothetical protein
MTAEEGRDSLSSAIFTDALSRSCAWKPSTTPKPTCIRLKCLLYDFCMLRYVLRSYDSYFLRMHPLISVCMARNAAATTLRESWPRDTSLLTLLYSASLCTLVQSLLEKEVRVVPFISHLSLTRASPAAAHPTTVCTSAPNNGVFLALVQQHSVVRIMQTLSASLVN